jgi:hypothetical protein
LVDVDTEVALNVRQRHVDDGRVNDLEHRRRDDRQRDYASSPPVLDYRLIATTAVMVSSITVILSLSKGA